jgi:cytoskeletal protein CcmA (bactofilin family)
MFERKKKQAAPPAPAPASPKPTDSTTTNTPDPVLSRNKAMIGPKISIKGTISGEEDLLIQGKVEGTISLGDFEVAIGESAEVKANIRAKAVKIDGLVEGDISGGEKVVISKSGNVHGNIIAPRVTLEDGAIFKGSIDMDPGETNTKKVSLAAEKPADRPQDPNTGSKASTQFDLKSG